MARFIHLTSANPGLLGKIRVNIDLVPAYYPQGLQTMVNLGGPGMVELVKESCAEVDKLIEAATGHGVNGKVLV